MLSSQWFLAFVAAGLSHFVFIVLRQGRALRVVLVLHRRSRSWLACLGLCYGLHGSSRARWVAGAVAYAVYFPPAVFCCGSPEFGVFGCEVVMLSPAVCLAGFVGWSLSSLPNGRLVLPLDVLSRCGRLGPVSVVVLAFGRDRQSGLPSACRALPICAPASGVSAMLAALVGLEAVPGPHVCDLVVYKS